MVEYLYNCIRAVAGQDIDIYAVAMNSDETLITEGCALTLHSDEEELVTVEGTYLPVEGMWQFTLPASSTLGLSGRYWYCIRHNDENLCFKEPIYLLR